MSTERSQAIAESSFADDEETAPAASQKEGDLTRTCHPILKGKKRTVVYDLSEMTPRLRRRLSNIDNDKDPDAADAFVEYLETCVISWDLPDRKGRVIELTTEGIETISYRDIAIIVAAMHGSSHPNESGDTE